MKQTKVYEIDAVAFDIDGTLYPSWKLTLRCIPFFFRYMRFMTAFRKVRKILHHISEQKPDEALPDFFGMQNQLLANALHITPDEAGSFLHEKIYDGWKKYFINMRPYPHVKDVIEQFKQNGLKIGILSDFPLEQKQTVWGVLPLCDAAIGSEAVGALKPSHIPFNRLAEALDIPCSRILYVGNSPKYDVEGAAAVGMKTACIRHPLSALFGKKIRNEDISFSNYRQLLTFVLR